MKISRMILDFASTYIHLGETLEEKQNYLNAACIAWNISLLPEDERGLALSKFLTNYKISNPDYDIEDIKHDMELLIKKKLRLFPNVNIPIAYAVIRETDTEYKVLAATFIQ